MKKTTIVKTVENTVMEKAAAEKQQKKQQQQKKEVATVEEKSTSYKNLVVDGARAKNLEDNIYNYISSNIKALEETKNLHNLLLSYNDFLKEFAKAAAKTTKEDKKVITDNSILLTSVSNLDLHKIIFNALYKISKERKAAAKDRIVVMKNNNGSCGVICTVKTEFYSEYYGLSDKKADTTEKAKKAREEKAAAKKAEEEKAAAEKAAEEEKQKNSVVDTPEKATIAILQLIKEFGNSLDCAAIYAALDNELKAAETEVKKLA